MEDIKPIDKFTLDKYVKEEDDLLEYVEMLGCKCRCKCRKLVGNKSY